MFILKKNIGTLDRIIRLVIGIFLLLIAYWMQSYIALALGIFTLFEAAFSWCVMYQLLGKNSCDINKK